MAVETVTGNCSREYLEKTIEKSRNAIAFAHPNADTGYAKAMLFFALCKLEKLNANENCSVYLADMPEKGN